MLTVSERDLPAFVSVAAKLEAVRGIPRSKGLLPGLMSGDTMAVESALARLDADQPTTNMDQPRMVARWLDEYATGERMDVRIIPAAGSNALILVGLLADVEDGQ